MLPFILQIPLKKKQPLVLKSFSSSFNFLLWLYHSHFLLFGICWYPECKIICYEILDFNICSSAILFSLCCLCGSPIIHKFACFNIFHRFLRYSSFLLSYFPIFPSELIFFYCPNFPGSSLLSSHVTDCFIVHSNSTAHVCFFLIVYSLLLYK